MSANNVLRGTHGNVDEEIAANRGPTALEMPLSFDRDRFQKLIGQKDFLAPKL